MTDDTQQPKSSQDWFNALELSKKELQKWQERGEKIVKRYRDDRSSFGSGKKYNILWSNIRTLMPAVYAKKPKAEANRRYKDADPVGRVAAEILQRSLQFEIDHYNDFDSALRNSILDRLLPGRGVAWVRYEPQYAPSIPEDLGETQITDDVEAPQELQAECSPVDYVYWKDFRHSPARTWEEVTWVARRVYMAQEEGVERFGEDFKQVPLKHEPIGVDDLKREGADTAKMKKAVVWEIWDKPTRTAQWVAEGFEKVLDEKQDPLQLEGFFPCPKPLFATLTTDTLVPIADYVMYQDQANELDEVTERISKLVEACKVVGVYDASQTGVQRMLSNGVDNTLIPVDTWAAFGEKGGLKGTIDFLPLDTIVNALNQLYQAREQTKQVIYEVTGLSDIIRGASVASETATAQQIKSQYASLRLKEMQTDVAKFASEILQIKAQIMCAFYDPQTLVTMSGMGQTPDAQYIPQAIELLRNDVIRNFRVEVETDSLVELDEAQEKQDRMEFLTAATGFIEKAVQAPPELAPLLGEMLMFGVRSFKAGKGMEASLEQFIQQATEKAKQPQQPQPNPEMLKLQAEQQKAQGEMQMKQVEMQTAQQAEASRMQLEQAKLERQSQLDQQRIQFEAAMKQRDSEQAAMLEQRRMEHEAALEEGRKQHEAMLKQMELDSKAQVEREKAELDASVKILVAQISAQTTTATAQMAAEAADRQVVEELAPDNGLKELAGMHGELLQGVQEMVKTLKAPKKRIGKKLDDGSMEVTEVVE